MLLSAACTTPPLAIPAAAPGRFADNPIVYFVITDRFANGDPSNDNAYGRKREAAPKDDVGTFHGGDLKGLSAKLKEGWFRQLGVNAVWITAPYEQIHGRVVGGNKEFKHYAAYTEGGRDDRTMQLAHLPDFRTDSREHVKLPAFLDNKRDTRARELPQMPCRSSTAMKRPGRRDRCRARTRSRRRAPT